MVASRYSPPVLAAPESGVLRRAHELADTVLFPASLRTDRAPIVSTALLDALADAGLYGLFASPSVGGLGLEREQGELVIEALAGGCLTTTFVWIQHLSTAALVSSLPGALHDEWARPLATGERKVGIAFSHLRRPDPPVLTAEPVDGGFLVDGSAPLVTGWGLVDAVHVAARTGPDITWLLVDAEEPPPPTLTVRRLELAAVNASATVALRFDRHFVPEGRLSVVQPLAEWLERDAAGLRTNGSLSLGVGSRCVSLLGDEAARHSLVRRLDEARSALAGASVGELPAARATACLAALDCAAALVAAGGGRAMLRSEHAQRLAREAMFLLVQGQTPSIRRGQLDMLAARRVP
jgi:alkylation response protein AidB-like acyl-CoA dehydrogenase